LEKVTEYIREGFTFGIKVFAPVIIIGAFFFLGSESMAKEILGPGATGLLTDIGVYLAHRVPLSKYPVVLMQALIGGITGLDGSGFSGLPLVGSLAQTFSTAVSVNKEGLAALAQGEDLTPAPYFFGTDFYDEIENIVENPVGKATGPLQAE
jgi:hypothetical protein